MAGSEIEHLIALLGRLPGLGPRSARRAALALVKRREALMQPLAAALAAAAAKVRACGICGNLDSIDPCAICADPRRTGTTLCVVADVGDLWALERSGAHRGRYHVLGGTLSALDGIGPEDLNVATLLARIRGSHGEAVEEVIVATNANVEGQTTAHYVADLLEPEGVRITQLAHGVPVGGELDYLDDGTLLAALQSRQQVQ